MIASRAPALLLFCAAVVSAQLTTPANPDYERGMGLARLEQWGSAESAFRAGQEKAPRDKRFPIELAGVAFKRKEFGAAKVHLRRALEIDPRDDYANDFLATLYLLDGNLGAALKYWNRSGKPRIEEVRIEPEPRVDPVLLDRAFVLSPASVLEARDFGASQARLEGLDIFTRRRLELAPRPDEKFDLVFRAVERNGWGNSTLDGLLGLLRGLPYQTIYPSFYNLRRAAVNVDGLLRWDAQKRRAVASVSAPLRRNPQWRYRVYLDGRKENWNLAGAFRGPLAGDLSLEKLEAGAELHSIVSERWGWSTGVALANRKFGNPPAEGVFTGGSSLQYGAGFDYLLLKIPDRRLTVASQARWQLGRMFGAGDAAFSNLQGDVESRWFPLPRGDDYAMKLRYRAGKSFGRVPFDELFLLGVDRDNDLWLRGHVATRDGKKGNAPMGRDYLLLNWELDKAIYKGALFTVTLGPLLDSGRIYDSSADFGSEKWLWDPGAQCKLRALGAVTLAFSYAKDLRSGRNGFYFVVSR